MLLLVLLLWAMTHLGVVSSFAIEKKSSLQMEYLLEKTCLGDDRMEQCHFAPGILVC